MLMCRNHLSSLPHSPKKLVKTKMPVSMKIINTRIKLNIDIKNIDTIYIEFFCFGVWFS